MNNTFHKEGFERTPIVGILRNVPKSDIGTIAGIYHDCGFNMLEVTMNSIDAEETITHLVKAFGNRLNIGAGTVCSMEDLDKALDAGASFIVTPVLNEEVVKLCVTLNIPVFAGAYTPTEIYKAWMIGATMVKVFPATKLGTQYIKDILAPLKHIKLMPTGGITLDNFSAFLQAGAAGLGIGSDLFPPALIKQGDWEGLRNIFMGFKDRYNAFTQSVTTSS